MAAPGLMQSYYDDLETIRTQPPIVPIAADRVNVTRVQIWNKSQHGLTIKSEGLRGGAGSRNSEESRSPLPAPKLPMRKEVPVPAHGFMKAFPTEYYTAMPSAPTGHGAYLHWTQDTMYRLSPDWRDASQLRLFEGLPMAENVVFVKHNNSDIPERDSHGKVIPQGTGPSRKIANGNCYWTAIALLVYGTARAWMRVKAEHLARLELVLDNPQHPDYQKYHFLNSIEIATMDKDRPVDLNMWEGLQWPSAWVNDEICHITADVYGVYVWLYKYNGGHKEWRNRVYDIRTYGVFNTRHIVLSYDDENHFRPMIPNDFLWSEFQMPRLTRAKTARYQLVTALPDKIKFQTDGAKHHMRIRPRRNDSHARALVQPSPPFTELHLARVVGYGPYNEKTLFPEADAKRRSLRNFPQSPTSIETPKNKPLEPKSAQEPRVVRFTAPTPKPNSAVSGPRAAEPQPQRARVALGQLPVPDVNKKTPARPLLRPTPPDRGNKVGPPPPLAAGQNPSLKRAREMSQGQENRYNLPPRPVNQVTPTSGFESSKRRRLGGPTDNSNDNKKKENEEAQNPLQNRSPPKLVNPSTGATFELVSKSARAALKAQPPFARSYDSAPAILPDGCRYWVKGRQWHFTSQTEFPIPRLEGWVAAITGISAAEAKKVGEQGGRQALVNRLLQDPGIVVYVEKGRGPHGQDRLCLDPEAGNEAEYGERGLWIVRAAEEPRGKTKDTAKGAA